MRGRVQRTVKNVSSRVTASRATRKINADHGIERKKVTPLWALKIREPHRCVSVGWPTAICAAERRDDAAHAGAVRHARNSKEKKEKNVPCQKVVPFAICHLVAPRKDIRRGAGSDAGVTYRRQTSGSRCRRSYRRSRSARPHSSPSRPVVPRSQNAGTIIQDRNPFF